MTTTHCSGIGRARPGVVVALVLASVVACSTGTGRIVRADVPPDPPRPDAVPATVLAVNGLGLDLLRTGGGGRANLAVAPLPVTDALAMLRAGAGPAGRAELDDVLGARRAPDLDAGLRTLRTDLDDRKGERRSDTRKGEVSFDLPTALWGQTDTRFDPRFLDRLATSFDAGMRVVDFRSDPNGSAAAVNRWMAGATGGRIQTLLPRGSVTEFTRLVATTGASVRAPFSTRFDPETTAPAPFLLDGGRRLEVPTMRAHFDDAATAKGPDWQAVGLPYLGDDLWLVLVVPTSGDLASLLERTGPDELDAIVDALRPATVEVALPRFGFTTELDLQGPLTSLGAGSLFEPGRAELSGITGDEPLSLSRAVHQTFAQAGEEGSDARAVTVVRQTSGARPVPPLVAADRPFLFVVLDRPTGLALQLGYVSDPTA